MLHFTRVPRYHGRTDPDDDREGFESSKASRPAMICRRPLVQSWANMAVTRAYTMPWPPLLARLADDSSDADARRRDAKLSDADASPQIANAADADADAATVVERRRRRRR